MINPVLGAAVAGSASGGTEYMAVLTEVMEEHAAELQGMSEQRKIAYILGREDWMAEARAKGFRRGIAVGVFDALTAGVAGKLMGALNKG